MAPEARIASRNMSIPRSLVRRAEADAPALSKSHATLFAEALRRGEATRNTMEDALVDYGRWILVNVFDDDAAAALDDKSENPVWVALLHRAGGPTLRISRRVLYVALEIAARDKRINDDVWRTLEPGRKELLLPLGDEPAMRKAAKHVVTMKLSQDKTRAYVASLRVESGNEPKSRLTIGRMTTRIRAFHTGLGSDATLRSLKKLAKASSPEDKRALAKEIAAVSAWVTAARNAIKG